MLVDSCNLRLTAFHLKCMRFHMTNLKIMYVMSDIFDHIIASVRYFDLEIFELGMDTDLEQ
jgi:hypothetical protein